MFILDLKTQVSDQFRLKLKNDALSFDYTHYVSFTGKKKHLGYCAVGDWYDAREMIGNIPFNPTGMVFTKFKAGDFISAHVDDQQTRVSCLSIPILPSLKYFAPVQFLDSIEEPNNVLYTHFYSKHPTVLNTKSIHQMFNNTKYDRYMFQVMYSEPIESFLPYVKK
jgi:hypothetical protein